MTIAQLAPDQVAFESIAAEVLEEVDSSIVKHGYHPEQPLGGGQNWNRSEAIRAKVTTDYNMRFGPVTWEDILREEVAEAFAETDPALVRAEMVQVAAVAMKIIDSIDRQAG